VELGYKRNELRRAADDFDGPPGLPMQLRGDCGDDEHGGFGHQRRSIGLRSDAIGGERGDDLFGQFAGDAAGPEADG